MDLGLRGRVVLVTGGSRGIGRAIAEAFAAEGARVTITYRTDREKAESVVEWIRQTGVEGSMHQLDLSDTGSIRSAVRTTIERWGRLDILVNNAAEFIEEGGYVGPLDGAPWPEWERLMQSNIAGTICAIREVAPIMKANHWGRILNISSVAATDGMPGYAWYAAAKASLHGLTRTLAKELGPSGVLVNVVMPGATSTDRLNTALHPLRLKSLAAALPIRSLPTPAEVAAVVLFLCSEKNAAVTGEIVRASGGRP